MTGGKEGECMDLGVGFGPLRIPTSTHPEEGVPAQDGGE